MNLLYFINLLIVPVVLGSKKEHPEKTEHPGLVKRGFPKVAAVKANGAGGGGTAKQPKPPKVCGTSYCDNHMFISNGNNVLYHVPNRNIKSAAAWTGNSVNSGVMTTTLTTGTSRVKYGGFCAQAQKSIYFLGNAIPVGIAAPSWIAKIPVGDLNLEGSFNPGLSYKIDVMYSDIVSMNAVTNFCKTACKGVLGCKYTSYGWEAPGGWFCKFYGTNICTDTTQIFWKPAPNSLSVLSVGGPAPIVIPGFGGCRITDTIPTTTPFLIPGSSIISPITAYTATLPYVTALVPLSTTSPIASVKCDVPAGGGITPGWPTFGTTWL